MIIVNDGSSDHTHKNLQSWIKSKHFSNVFYLNYAKNQGKSHAVQEGLKIANGKYSIIQDADLEYDIQDIRRLVDYIKKNNVEGVISYRRSKFKRINLYDIILKSGVVTLNIIFNFLYKSKFKDLSSGYKIFKTECFKSISLEGKGFTFDYEVIIKFLKKNYSLGQLDVSYNPRSKSDGKKIRIKDGIECFFIVMKYLKS